MYCRNCGKELPDGSKFCSECGCQIEEKQSITNEQEFEVKQDNTVTEQKNKIILLVSKIAFVIIPIIAFFMVMPAREGAAKIAFSAFTIALSILWIVSYFANKKLSVSEKKGKGNAWRFIGGLLLVMAIFISFSQRVPVDEASSSDTTTTTIVTTTEPTTEAMIEISAKELIKAYQENEINASNKYKGKYLKITGYVDNVSQSDNTFLSDSYYIYIDYGNDYDFNDLSCRLNDESIEKAATLKPGDKIVITGRCEGFSVTSIDIYDCTIIK